MKLSLIKPNPDNPRIIKDKRYKQLLESMRRDPEYLEGRPIIIGTNSIILAGNMRHKAAKELKMEDVPVKDFSHLSEEKQRRFVMIDNEGFGITDWDLVADQYDMDELEEWGIELPDDLQPVQEIEEDEAPEVDEQSEQISQLGEVYQLGRHRLLCGDSTKIEDVEKLMDGKKADMVFTDPPYGMDLDTDYTGLNWGDRKGKKYDAVIGDNDDFIPELITKIFDNFGYCKEMFLWGADYYFELIPEFKKGHYIVWDKTLESNGDAGSNSEYELLWTKQKHKRTVMHFNWFRFFGLSKQDGGKRIHPTQKPLQVLTPIIEKYSKEKDVIIDVFGGSGSTLIACEQTDRTCYMMELDPKYCDVIRKRYHKLVTGSDEGWDAE